MSPIEAIILARQLHEGQVDKAGAPYIGHVTRVYQEVYYSKAPDYVKIAAALHDVMEDCGQDEASLMAQGVPQKAIDLVRILTRSRGEKYDEYLTIISHDVDATMIKLADLKDNMDPFRLIHVPAGLRSALIAKYSNAMELLLLGCP